MVLSLLGILSRFRGEGTDIDQFRNLAKSVTVE